MHNVSRLVCHCGQQKAIVWASMNEYKCIDVKPFGANIGAEIKGIDITSPLEKETVREIKAAWQTHLVLLFREQNLEPEQHMSFAQNFGEPQTAGFVPTLKEFPFIRHQELNKNPEEKISKIGGANLIWHHDDSFWEMPSKGSILHALDVPHVGGDTLFVSMIAAYNALSKEMQSIVDNLTCYHDLTFYIQDTIIEEMGIQALERIKKENPPVEHPLVVVQPKTGKKALYVDEMHVSQIKEMHPEESKWLLEFLYQHTSKPEFQCRIRWSNNAVIMWDNLCVKHRGVHDFGTAHREMQRVALVGEHRPKAP